MQQFQSRVFNEPTTTSTAAAVATGTPGLVGVTVGHQTVTGKEAYQQPQGQRENECIFYPPEQLK